MSAARPHNRIQGAMGIAAAVTTVVGITALLHTRAAMTGNGIDIDTAPLAVEATRYILSDSYQRSVSYLGLVTAGRKADLAFEVPGRVASLPLRQGTPVRAGDVLAQLDDASLKARRAATRASLKRARSELELARIKARRQQELRDSGAVSREAVDETRLRATALAAQVEAVAAQLEAIDIDLRKTRLLAPYDGVVADRYIDEGAVISGGAPIIKLVENGGREAHIGVAASRAGELQPGAAYRVRLRGQTVAATLLSVRPDVDPITRSTTAVFALPQDLGALDGEPVTLELSETVALRGGWLPLAALLEGSRGLWTVLRIDAADGGSRTLRESVEVLDIQGDRAYVRGTLADGAEVVSVGVHRITPGAEVALAEAGQAGSI